MSVLCHMALRMVSQTTLKESLSQYEESRPFCTNAHLRPPEDFLQRTLMAAFLLRCLQKTNYFIDGEGNDDDVPNEEEQKIGELLLYNLEMLQFNAHEIYETRYEQENELENAKIGYIAVALYPTVALFNHECYPAVTRHFVGRSIVITAVRPLKLGDVIAENYGPIFTRKPLISRQKALSSRYWFECKCEACSQDWPSFETGLETITNRLRCPNDKCTNFFTLPLSNEKLRCPRCKKNVSMVDFLESLKEVQKNYGDAHDLVKEGKTDEATVLLCDGINTFHLISRPPHGTTHVAQEVLRACLAHRGNVYVKSKS
uniref:SET domain-containing protein n=4 Tax=Photinus pyralis TaxID=7054 RepID=A0A1Y1K3J4_PHOPY